MKAGVISLAIGILPLFACASPSVVHVTQDAQTPAATRAVAEAFLNEWLEGKGQMAAYRRFADPRMTQHDPRVADGLAGVESFLAAGEGAREQATLLNMVLVDGDLFAIHRLAFDGEADRGTATVEIWRVRAHRIVEHWSARQPVPADIPHANGMGCGPGQRLADAKAQRDPLNNPTCRLPDTGTTRAQSLKVFDDYTGQVARGDVAAAMREWLSNDYRQHSPMIADGIQGALVFLMMEFGRGDAAMPKFGPIRTVAEGDLVLKHRITTYEDGKRTANVDIFRITKGKVSEHWDVIQPMPATSANGNGMW